MLIYFFYRLLTALAFPLYLLYLLRRGLRDTRYFEHVGERFGHAPLSWNATVPGGIWLHAVSVGEVVSAIEFMRQLRIQLPAQRLYLSVTTVAARHIADEKLRGVADAIFYAPLDMCWIVRRVLRRLRPQVVVILETEIWPNLFRESKRFGCGLIVVNGRISDVAFPRYQQWRLFFQEVLRWPDEFLVQNEIALERYAAIGAPKDKLRVNGNLKYDFRADSLQPPEAVKEFVARLQPAEIVIAASTMPPAQDGDPDEDGVIVESFLQLRPRHPKLLVILVPRRPERFASAADKLLAAGVPCLRRSALGPHSTMQLPGVLVVDTMGELASLFPLCDVVFMGGTFPHRGGHNILEPAFAGKPVIIGPHMENFPDIAAEFRAANAVYEIAEPKQLADAITTLLGDETLRRQISEKARALAEAKRGTTERAVEAVHRAYTNALPVRIETLWTRFVLSPFSGLWTWATAFDRRRKIAQQRKLNTPVISIGGITMGGTGKTPLVAWLAERLHREGLKPAILTRGYRRAIPEKHTLLAPGQTCPVARTGDEAQIFLRAGHAALGIGADRFTTGQMMEQRFHPGVFLLDDGFQHWKLFRDVDIVVLDALRPFGNGEVFPLGTLREKLPALHRASAFVINRADFPTPWHALENRLRDYQPLAPIFYARIQPVEWVHGDRVYAPDALPSKDVAAFCGLGNPAAFWRTLDQLGVRPKYRWSFGDHSDYRAKQLQALAHEAKVHGAKYLLTTEKDAMNLPSDFLQLIKPLELLWLRVRIQIDREAAFLEWLESELQTRKVQ